MEIAGIIVISLTGLGFAGVAVALGVRNGGLRATIASLSASLDKSKKDHAATMAEFEGYQRRTKNQLEKLRDELTDMEDMLAACDDPVVIRGHLDRMLQKASGGDGDPSSD